MGNNELIKIEVNEKQEPIVSGRDLHDALGIKTEYKKWFARMCEYDFVENQDYARVTQKCPTLGGEQEITNHAIKLDMAKEIAMIQRNEAGKKIRQYFIQVEKDYNSPEKIMARSLIYANNQINQLTVNITELNNKIEEQKPKVLFADAVATSKNSILVGDMAKILKQNGVDIGQNRFFEYLRREGFLCGKSGEMYNTPTQRSMNLGIMETKQTITYNPDGTSFTRKTPKITGKGQQYFINKFLNMKEVANEE